MRSTTKIAISADHCAFGVHLAFGMLQRRVFANRALDIHLLTTDADGEAKRTAAHVQNCGFSNLNGTTKGTGILSSPSYTSRNVVNLRLGHVTLAHSVCLTLEKKN